MYGIFSCLHELSYKFPADSTYLDHGFIDMGFLPIGGLCDADLTPEERENWSDVLDADVRRVFPGAYGIHIEVEDVEPERMSDFSSAVSVGQISKQQQPKMGL